MNRTVVAEKAAITYELERKPVKNYNLRVRSDGTVHLSVPTRTSYEAADAFVADAFVKKNTDFILKYKSISAERNNADPLEVRYLGNRLNLEIKYGEKGRAELSDNTLSLFLPQEAINLPEDKKTEFIQSCIKDWQKSTAERIFSPLLKKVYGRFIEAGLSIPYPTFTVRFMKTRWGSCTFGKNKISLNASLIDKPPACIEYVICHELAHFLQQNHSDKFYAVLDRVMPEHRQIKRMLQKK